MGLKSERTKRLLADALIGLLREVPYAKISVRAVAERAGVDRQTFYYHFSTMNDLAEYTCRLSLSSLLSSDLSNMSVEQAFSYVVSQIDANRETLKFLVEGVGRSTLRDMLYDDVRDVLLLEAESVVEACRVEIPRRDIEFAVSYCQHASATLIVEWLLGHIEVNGREMAQWLSRSFVNQMRGLALDASRRQSNSDME